MKNPFVEEIEIVARFDPPVTSFTVSSLLEEASSKDELFITASEAGV